MKQDTRRLADVDMGGRVRRVRREPEKLVKITLMGSMFGTRGLDVDLPVRNDIVEYAGWQWTWAGKKTPTGRRIFAKMPTERGVWKFILFLIGKNGKDPRLNERPRPFVHTDTTRPVKHGRGARRRREKAAHA
jgi:hypothetical protein